MLSLLGCSSLEELISQTVPKNIRLKKPLNIGSAMSEHGYLQHLKSLGAMNRLMRSHIGQGYYPTLVPPVIQRNILENPGWYTAYTPYQAEIAQGRLEAILNFQTMVMDLTGMEIANASLLDEATAAAEAMIMFHSSRSRDAVKRNAHRFFVSEGVFPQTLDVLKTRSAPIGVELVVGNHETQNLDSSFFGALVQYPDRKGRVHNFEAFAAQAKAHEIMVCVASDLLALALLKPPGEWGADAVVGNSQRFGVPMGYGGPHAAFFACREEYKRLLPGRIIGVSLDAQGKPALRMALQTREQHIRRDKATSNICTAQALLAIMAGMYAVYHGPEGIHAIAQHVHSLTQTLHKRLCSFGLVDADATFFDTLCLNRLTAEQAKTLRDKAEEAGINFYYGKDGVCISLDETCGAEQVEAIAAVCKAAQQGAAEHASPLAGIPGSLKRSSSFLQHEVFNSHRSETQMMRYIKRLENRDLSLTHSMISLGSCTMKLNAAAELYPITWPEFANLHPFAPIDQTKGYQAVLEELNRTLSEITGFAGMSFQPNSGAQGEYAGLMVIRQYHISRGDTHRNVALIPSSAHGTNPASAAMAGMHIVVVKCDEHGNIDLQDLKEKTEANSANLSCLMVTYPSTHGVFEEAITEITSLIHQHGGQVYMDGANMNAQVGLTSPGSIGADVCHLNLHKTFAIPHGGGGPGMGPIGVAAHLLPFLPGHSVVPMGSDHSIHAVSAAPWGSALILLISYGYIKMLGAEGVTRATEVAILNANYMKERLAGHYQTLYVGKEGRCAHEMILDCRDFKRTAGVEVADIAKRLMDYGFHAPTVAFPVADTLMVEPTESESKEELDRFCEAMIQIRKEIEAIATGNADKADNLLKHAPHTARVISSDTWTRPYSRQEAAYPLSWVSEAKFWPSVGRVDNAYGDRHLVCSCPPVESYAEEVVVS